MTTLDKYRDYQKRTRKKSARRSHKKTSRTKKDGFIFSIAGVHGVGKTTIYNILSKTFKDFTNIKLYPERLRAVPPVPFGSKNKQTAFRAEIHYNQQMIERNRLVSKFIKNHRENIAILDRSPLSTLIYARALSLPKIDYDLIDDTYRSVSWLDECVIYLEAEPKTVMSRIYKRGSLDKERQKWNEDDYQYLLRVLKKYEEIFKEFKLQKSNKFFRIWTENKTPQEVVGEIFKIIEQKSGLQLKKKVNIPINQSKLTNWCD
ncbi:deoxynucleoside kinase [Candidatus Lokiarchaeum ossiferum]|uniref:deoxynucleoside kinase n=1 Tax=Candidatus Lokiarchaeum ossiferum TaxID=2951803 RepID=UPI00352DF3DA